MQGDSTIPSLSNLAFWKAVERGRADVVRQMVPLLDVDAQVYYNWAFTDAPLSHIHYIMRNDPNSREYLFFMIERNYNFPERDTSFSLAFMFSDTGLVFTVPYVRNLEGYLVPDELSERLVSALLRRANRVEDRERAMGMVCGWLINSGLTPSPDILNGAGQTVEEKWRGVCRSFPNSDVLQNLEDNGLPTREMYASLRGEIPSLRFMMWALINQSENGILPLEIYIEGMRRFVQDFAVMVEYDIMVFAQTWDSDRLRQDHVQSTRMWAIDQVKTAIGPMLESAHAFMRNGMVQGENEGAERAAIAAFEILNVLE